LMSSGQRSAAVRNGNIVVRGRQARRPDGEVTLAAIAQCEQPPIVSSGSPPRGQDPSRPFLRRATFIIRRPGIRHAADAKKKGRFRKMSDSGVQQISRTTPSAVYYHVARSRGENGGRYGPSGRKRKVVFPDAPYLKSCRLRFFKSHYVYIRLVKRRHDILTPSHCRGISVE